MTVQFTAYPNEPRILMSFGTMCRFAHIEHIIKQAARNGQRRLQS